jgi:serine phosphatase RsbU (regulator of sigma subunit)/catechol 2,3-dioxygenase-like lactoylglutathione lyase family enzyme
LSAKPTPSPKEVPRNFTDPATRGCEECPYLRIFSTTVFVRNHDESLKFYIEQLGFGLVVDLRYDFDDRWVAIAPPDGSTVLALVAPKRGSENYKHIGKPTNIAFFAEDINATYDAWRSRGVHFEHPPQASLFGGILAKFRDIDGNTFELLGSDALSRQVEAQRQQAAEKLEQERRASQELEIAKQVQARLFPQTLPPLKTLEYAGICKQARHVGGDYYDFLSLGNERVGLVIGDISGKGIAAALLMANLQANLRSQFTLARDEPQLFLKSVNRLFYANSIDSAYATVFFADYDDAAQRLRYANCGHLSAILLSSDGKVDWLHSTGTVLGLFEEWDSPIHERQLYTDGVTESPDASGEEFGEARLIAALQKHRQQPAQQILGAIIEQIQRFSPAEQHDDITLIVAKCTASA